MRSSDMHEIYSHSARATADRSVGAALRGAVGAVYVAVTGFPARNATVAIAAHVAICDPLTQRHAVRSELGAAIVDVRALIIAGSAAGRVTRAGALTGDDAALAASHLAIGAAPAIVVAVVPAARDAIGEARASRRATIAALEYANPVAAAAEQALVVVGARAAE